MNRIKGESSGRTDKHGSIASARICLNVRPERVFPSILSLSKEGCAGLRPFDKLTTQPERRYQAGLCQITKSRRWQDGGGDTRIGRYCFCGSCTAISGRVQFLAQNLAQCTDGHGCVVLRQRRGKCLVDQRLIALALLLCAQAKGFQNCIVSNQSNQRGQSHLTF